MTISSDHICATDPNVNPALKAQARADQQWDELSAVARRAIKSLEEVTAQRNELLTALRHIERLGREGNTVTGQGQPMQWALADIARGAIAKVEGQS
jgi:hypothetical protein